MPLLEVATETGRPAFVELAARELIAREGRRVEWLGALVRALNRQGEFAEAEPLAREYGRLAASEPRGSWSIDARGALGCALVGTGEHEEAEPLLLEVHEALQHAASARDLWDYSSPLAPTPEQVHEELCAALVELYRRLDEPEEVAYWSELAGR